MLNRDEDDSEHSSEQSLIALAKPKRFQMDIPQGARLVCLAGAHDSKRLLSLYAYYN